MPDFLRTFIALELCREHLTITHDIVTGLKHSDADIKWVDPDHFHITLKFLGQTPQSQISLISRALDALAMTVPAFPLALKDIGAFPDIDKPQVIWIGVSQGGPELSQLSKSVQEYLLPFGFLKDNRPFHAHVTIGRSRTNHGAKRLSAVLKNIPVTSMAHDVRHITLFESILTSQGPRYSVLHRSPLK
jgi:2'-5' RNA ligase